MTPDEQRQIDKVEQDRRRREEALLLLLLLMIGGAYALGTGGTGRRRNPASALRFATDAIRMGHDPLAAMRSVIYGSSTLHLPGIVTPLERAMDDAHTAGDARAHDLAGVPVPDVGEKEATPPRRYADEAKTIADTIYAGLATIVTRAVADAKAEGLRTPGVVQRVRDAFVRYGWTSRDPAAVNPDSKGSPGYAAAGVATDAVLTAYGAGMFQGYNVPAVQTKLSGYRHVSVMDNRTSETCIDRDGLVLPKDDPYWRGRCVPPLHPRCRSILLPTFGVQEWSDRTPTVVVNPPWGGGGLPGF